jgi:hypothetical protein
MGRNASFMKINHVLLLISILYLYIAYFLYRISFLKKYPSSLGLSLNTFPCKTNLKVALENRMSYVA